MVASAYIQAVRWKTIVKPLGDYSAWQTFKSVTIGHWFNAVLPARMGELARPFHFAKKNHLPFSTVLATTVLERIFDMLAVLLLAVFCVVFLWLRLDKYYMVALASAYFIGVAILFFLSTNKAFILNFSSKKNNALSFLAQPVVLRFLDGLTLITDSWQFCMVAFATVGVWTLNIIAYWLLIKACQLPTMLQTPDAGVVVTLASAISHAIPSTASGIGVVNYGIILGLEQFAILSKISLNVVSESIVAASLVIYIAAIVPDVIIGGWFYWQDKDIFLDFTEAN